MKIFRGDNFTKIYYEMLLYAIEHPTKITGSRVGLVKDLGPAYIEIVEDEFRLCYLLRRNINPFFALVEFSWIISGSNELLPLEQYIKSYSKFSDDGKTLNGAYGFRLRSFFGFDQINRAIEILRYDQNSRRVVLNMWSPTDLNIISKDLPCNTSVFLKIRDQRLDMTVVNRSNDLYLGIPYNVFVFYLLQLYISQKLGCQIGVQRHFTDSLHLYQENFGQVEKIISANSFQSINLVKTKIKGYNFKEFINLDHEKILKNDYQAIRDTDLKRFFNSYFIKAQKGLNLLPKNLLGFLGYLWMLEYNKLPQNMRVDYFENIIKEISMTKESNNLEYIKSGTVEEIHKFITLMADEKQYLYDRLLEVINLKNSLFVIDSENQVKLLKAILLSLVLGSVTSNILNPMLKNDYISKIQKVCSLLGIEYNDLLVFLKYEDEFKNVLNNS
ncbi:hypothetical protein JCM14036_30790 [Desulfotomaculum defluvii]